MIRRSRVLVLVGVYELVKNILRIRSVAPLGRQDDFEMPLVVKVRWRLLVMIVTVW